ncbi:MAG: hypothetical protein O2968_16730 [Acidobacteria bacterium]|nr:hypothetical protein [Acidobacteriota bacterium]
MKRISRWLTIGFCSLTLTAGLALAAKPNIKNRQMNQADRIRDGVANGSLTRPEARRLTRNQARLHRLIVRDRADGGVLTPRERAKAQHRLSRQSRAIARQMHDAQSQP